MPIIYAHNICRYHLPTAYYGVHGNVQGTWGYITHLITCLPALLNYCYQLLLRLPQSSPIVPHHLLSQGSQGGARAKATRSTITIFYLTPALICRVTSHFLCHTSSFLFLLVPRSICFNFCAILQAETSRS